MAERENWVSVFCFIISTKNSVRLSSLVYARYQASDKKQTNMTAVFRCRRLYIAHVDIFCRNTVGLQSTLRASMRLEAWAPDIFRRSAKSIFPGTREMETAVGAAHRVMDTSHSTCAQAPNTKIQRQPKEIAIFIDEVEMYYVSSKGGCY